ncbi:MAG: AAA family ATPase, partial [Clostridiales bacterium]|nr:AAA family ATPase [Clostridiales bacterium]
VIGCILSGAKADLAASDFGTPQLQTAWEAAQRMTLAGRPIDLITLDHETSGTITGALVDSQRLGYMPSMVGEYAGIVREQATRRRVAQIARGMSEDAQDATLDMAASIENARRQLSDIGSGQRHAWTTSSELAVATLGWLESLNLGKVKPISSGTAALDKLIGGFYPGELSIVGAKPGVGKTVFGMTLAIHAAQMGRRVGVMNLEMLDTQYGSRMVSNLGGIDAMKLRLGDIKDDEWPLIVQTVNKLSQLPAAYLFSTRYIEDLARAVREKGDIELLVVDYLQLVRTRQKLESERLRMAHISWALKELAVDLRIPVIAMSQLRRPEAGASDRMPSMRDLRESGNLEADADGIILLHEPASHADPYVHQHDKDSFDDWRKKGLRYICMKVEKQRQGAVGSVPVLFEANMMRYIGIER